MGHSRGRAILVCAVMGVTLAGSVPVRADVSKQDVELAIERARRFLISRQSADGSWPAPSANLYQVGVTGLATLALLNSGMTPNDPPVLKGLDFIRRSRPDSTYNLSVTIMALAAAKDPRNKPYIERHVRRLENLQARDRDDAGSWSYTSRDGGRDRSNGQFAVLALWEAQQAGISVDPETWRLARDHWKNFQRPDGGWNYNSRDAPSTGSMTVAGIATLAITEAMVRLAEDDLNPDGTPNCCNDRPPDKSLDDAIRWLGRNFSVRHNPGSNDGWYLYYMYGLERAGRLSAHRFFGEDKARHDWYREGAEMFVRSQLVQDGSWTGVGMMEKDSVVGTCYGLLFLSKGLAPVLINKLHYGGTANDPRIGGVWNRHPDDVRNLTQLISGLPKWPKLLNWQIVELEKSQVTDLLQAPVLFLNGNEALNFTPEQVKLLRDYVAEGGFIYAEQTCRGTEFDKSFKELVKQMYPDGDVKLAPLTPEHPIYRSEYLIDARSTPLWGAEVGCRTSIVYSPNDYSCLWDKWTSFAVPKRSPQAVSMITKATNVGVNVIAYATGREPASKLDTPNLLANEGFQVKLERGQLQVATLRHTGDWNAAPMALRNLLAALNKTIGMVANTKVRELSISDPNLYVYPMLYMHGRQPFQLSEPERTNLQKYITNQGVLFADACCGSTKFDRSFREEMVKLFPEHKLKRIPVTHALFKPDLGGHDIKRVKRREIETTQPDAPLNPIVREVEPFLEGIEIDGRYVVIYSRYDISCALERQNATTCSGYLQEDAVRLAVNIVIYLMQN